MSLSRPSSRSIDEAPAAMPKPPSTPSVKRGGGDLARKHGYPVSARSKTKLYLQRQSIQRQSLQR